MRERVGVHDGKTASIHMPVTTALRWWFIIGAKKNDTTVALTQPMKSASRFTTSLLIHILHRASEGRTTRIHHERITLPNLCEKSKSNYYRPGASSTPFWGNRTVCWRSDKSRHLQNIYMLQWHRKTWSPISLETVSGPTMNPSTSPPRFTQAVICAAPFNLGPQLNINIDIISLT